VRLRRPKVWRKLCCLTVSVPLLEQVVVVVRPRAERGKGGGGGGEAKQHWS